MENQWFDSSPIQYLKTGENRIVLGQMSVALADLNERIQQKQIEPFQVAFFAPPLPIQDFSIQQFPHDSLLQLAYYSFYHVFRMLKDSGFIVVHTFGQNYSRFKILLDEIFGPQNFIATIIWQKYKIFPPTKNRFTAYNYYQTQYDSILIYCKNPNEARFHKFPPTTKGFFNPDNDPRGVWESRPLIASEKASNPVYTYTFQNGFQLTRKFRYAPTTITKLEDEKRIHFTHPKGKAGIPRVKIFYRDRLIQFEKSGEKGRTPNSLWCDPEEFGSLESIWQESITPSDISSCFSFQSQQMYEKLLYLTSIKHERILDCFGQTGIFEKIIHQSERELVSIKPIL